jgi:hypothetical protein
MSLMEKVESLVIRKGGGDDSGAVTDVTDPGAYSLIQT